MSRWSAFVIAVLAWSAAGCTGIERAPHEEAYGIVTTFPSNVPGYVYPARISTIDGDNIAAADERRSFQLPPGTHTIRIVADLSQATGKVRSVYTPRSEQPGTVEIFVEAGRRYYIGAYFEGGRADEWEAKVWKVEDIENYNHSITRM
jgi:hypothetical protein